MKFLKLVALGYVVKTALFGAAWLLIPDLPQRTATLVRETWAWVAHHDAEPRPAVPVTATLTDADTSEPLPAPAK
jgi:hypothetical protein